MVPVGAIPRIVELTVDNVTEVPNCTGLAGEFDNVTCVGPGVTVTAATGLVEAPSFASPE
jgi:hypothetical protein